MARDLEKLNFDDLDEWFSIPKLAQKFGCSRRAMFDKLMSLHEASRGRLLKNASKGKKPYYLTTLRLLRTYDPAMYSEYESFGLKIQQLEMEVFQLRQVVTRLGAWVSEADKRLARFSAATQKSASKNCAT